MAKELLRKKRLDKIRAKQAIDPFAAERKAILRQMEEGMDIVLHLHNKTELGSLCGCLGIFCKDTTANQRIGFVKEEIEEVPETERQAKYLEILTFIWEGILFEYLRCIGHPVSSTQYQPRQFVISHWRNLNIEDKADSASFIPHFIKRELKDRSETVVSDDLQDEIDEIAELENQVKTREKGMKKGNDYRHILGYLHGVYSLRGKEESFRQKLLGEVDRLRANSIVQNDTVSILASQLEELELKYERVVTHCSVSGATDMTIARSVVDRLANNQIELLALNRIIIEKLPQEEIPPNHPVIPSIETVSKSLDLYQGWMEGMMEDLEKELEETQDELNDEKIKNQNLEADKLNQKNQIEELEEGNMAIRGALNHMIQEMSFHKAMNQVKEETMIDNWIDLSSSQNGAWKELIPNITQSLKDSYLTGHPKESKFSFSLLTTHNLLSSDGLYELEERKAMDKEEKESRINEEMVLEASGGGKKKKGKGKKKKKGKKNK